MSAVSAIIASYNYAHFVVEAVESALAQSRPCEVIVVDDGSTDDTRARLASFGHRIKYIYQKNAGISAARNAGVRASRGEWLAFLDADDVWHPHKTERQLEAAARYTGAALVGSPAHVDALPVELPPATARMLGVIDFLTSTPICPSAALVRRSAFDAVGGFDETLRTVEDRDLWLRLAMRFPSVQVMSPCLCYRRHEHQLSRKAQRMYECYERVLRSFFRAHPEAKPDEQVAYAYMYLDAAIAFLDEGESARARDLLLRSLYTQPLAAPRLPRLSTERRLKLLVRATLGESLFRRLRARTGA
jgi:glycosyltransferase involved in cell wall biosynthesis